MYLFLVSLILGFACNLASAFTLAFSRRWGEQIGSFLTIILRNVFGIPVWAAGYVLAVRTPSPNVFAPSLFSRIGGWAFIASGGGVILAALVTIRLRSAAPSTRDTLAASGLYASVRHPVYSGTFLEFVGLWLLKPTWAVAIACLLGTLWIFIQTRLEELDLLQRVPGYAEYRQRVPPFWPRLRRTTGTDEG